MKKKLAVETALSRNAFSRIFGIVARGANASWLLVRRGYASTCLTDSRIVQPTYTHLRSLVFFILFTSSKHLPFKDLSTLFETLLYRNSYNFHYLIRVLEPEHIHKLGVETTLIYKLKRYNAT
jgi:hypothetical protein